MSGSENLRDTQPYDGESQKDSEDLPCRCYSGMALVCTHIANCPCSVRTMQPILKFPLRSIRSKMSYLQDTVHSIFSNKG
ncbi:uncharacterized protein BT62DRAFT_938046 [Guyanagaster necrorhizus]|uniref:Uncharacterized protein n=1 Tax=Guyanagaster necrorhizus TaxID=856835 RepID=A0A9P8AM71_9AGAR|nr:uncharacterized protein BT62DRAFT_938046 [Guyanagaster necrorhizus MCA 3950]KAG7440376.1 hypothetical protein BT62DRAFT_938046 [Guyanagaster necrorhizus MCA 3950]